MFPYQLTMTTRVGTLHNEFLGWRPSGYELSGAWLFLSFGRLRLVSKGLIEVVAVLERKCSRLSMSNKMPQAFYAMLHSLIWEEPFALGPSLHECM